MNLARWEQWTNWPLTAASIAFLAAYAGPIIWPDLPASVDLVCDVITWSTWALFVLDSAARMALAEDRRRYFFRHCSTS